MKIPNVTTGNAGEDGRDFRHWFVGDLARWAGLAEPAARERFGPRQSALVSVKWGVHPANLPRPDGWAEGDEFVTLSVLVSGDFVLSFEDAAGGVIDAHLVRPGDYAIWWPGTRHVWRTRRDSIIFTVRWRP